MSSNTTARDAGSDCFDCMCISCRCCCNCSWWLVKWTLALALAWIALMTLGIIAIGKRVGNESWLTVLSTAFVPVLTLSLVVFLFYLCCVLIAQQRQRAPQPAAIGTVHPKTS